MKTRYKFLNKQGRSVVSAHGNLKWKVGEWQAVDENRIKPCNYGLHCSKKVYQAFSYVQGEVLAKVEVRGKHIDESDKEVWSEMRITEAYKWTKKDSVELAIFAAEQVIDIYEKQYPNDKRPRDAIEAAKRYIEKPTKKNMDAAYAAYDAAYAAAHDAHAAANAAAHAAAYAAAHAAAYAAAYAAHAAYDARAAANAAAYAAHAVHAAHAAAYAALIRKIDRWMTNRIKELEPIK